MLLESPKLSIKLGESVALMGKSGSGKSRLARELVGMPRPLNEVKYKGDSLSALSDAELRRMRQTGVAHVPQEFDTALTPTMKIGDQLLETESSTSKALDLLFALRISEPMKRFEQYPFQLSGGMCQRILIAIALLRNPECVILDEPTSALDRETALSVLNVVREKVSTLLLITHDRELAEHFTDRIVFLDV